MMIREMSKEECLHLLTGVRLMRLACASGNQPYVIPMYLAYHQPVGGKPCLYGFTTIGQKIDWMRANPLVCVEFDNLASDTEWVSIIVVGRYEELPSIPTPNVGRFPNPVDDPGATVLDAPQSMTETIFVHDLLEARAMWWEPALTSRAALAHRDSVRGVFPIYYKVWIDQVTGHQSIPETQVRTSSEIRLGRPGILGWLRKTLSRVPGKV